MADIDLTKLAEPFPPEDVEWRIGRAGNKDGKVWAKVLAYITNRAIMERLDEVCGPENWKNDFREGPAGGVLCGIAIRLDGEWVWKWDGADNTDIEPTKGGLSGSMKRAAVQWGVGRYLYDLPEGWANVHENGEKYGKVDGQRFNWDPPELPGWALPGGSGRPENGAPPENVDTETGEVVSWAERYNALFTDEYPDSPHEKARVEKAFRVAHPDLPDTRNRWTEDHYRKAVRQIEAVAAKAKDDPEVKGPFERAMEAYAALQAKSMTGDSDEDDEGDEPEPEPAGAAADGELPFDS